MDAGLNGRREPQAQGTSAGLNDLSQASMPRLDAISSNQTENFLSRDSIKAAVVAIAGLLGGGAAAQELTQSPQPAKFQVPARVQRLDEEVLSPQEVKQTIFTIYNPASSRWEREHAEIGLINADPGAVQTLPMAKKLLADLESTAPDWQRKALNDYIVTRSLNIEFSQRIAPPVLDEIIANRLSLTPDGRPLAIVVNAKGDHNGAFYLGANMYTEMQQAGYRILYFEAETDTELAEVLKLGTQLGTAKEQKAQLLIFGGHGTPTSLHLERHWGDHPGKHGIIDFSDKEFFEKTGLKATLKDGGYVVLDSCSNGAGEEQGDNMANFVRKIFPQAKAKGIWSATESYGPIWLHFDKNGELERVQYPVPEYRARRDGRGPDDNVRQA
jgi:hypothetical protein